MPFLRCKDCKKEFIITMKDMDVALIELIKQGKIDGGHVWHTRGRKYDLRHPTREECEYLEEEGIFGEGSA
jgi:hypothetical protein